MHVSFLTLFLLHLCSKLIQRLISFKFILGYFFIKTQTIIVLVLCNLCIFCKYNTTYYIPPPFLYQFLPQKFWRRVEGNKE